jgi:choline dehydrogenase-like flavoprotein
MSSLSRRQRSTLEGLAEALLPSGLGLPGANEADVARAIEERMISWRPRVAAGVRFLLRTWDLGPLLSKHTSRFSNLDPETQAAWTERCYRSRWTARRLQVAALKQLIFLAWASSPVVEDAIGYDYRCARDDEPHGAARTIAGSEAAPIASRTPRDYFRDGPAIASKAVPAHLTTKRDFERPDLPALTTITHPDIGDGHRTRVDVIVVGSGAGGATVACYLAEAGLDVAVLEEGPHVTSADFQGPMLDRFQRMCRDNGTTQVWGTPPIPLPLGRVVGGTTVVNSGTCFRAPEKVLHRWETEFGIEDADPNALASHYSEIEDFLNVRPVPWPLLGPNGRVAHAGAKALGYSGGPLLRNIADCHGCGQCAFGCPTDAKQAMHISFLPRAQHAGARIYSNCRVDRIVIDNGRATGVVASLATPEGSRGRVRFDASHVVVCAGAIHTPVLLMGSGVADRADQTGRNLRIHPATGVGGFFDGDHAFWKGTLQSYYIDEFFDSHEIMFEATTTVPSIGAGSMPGIGAKAMNALGRFGDLATLGFYVSDTSKGRVRRLPSGEAFPTYRLNVLDTTRMAFALATGAEILLAAGAREVHVGLPGIDSISAREDLEQVRTRRIRPEHLRLTAFHPMGTARMGSDPDAAVVDPFGRHHATDNLWVADASVFPTCVGVNPQMTIMAFAKRTAEALIKS